MRGSIRLHSVDGTTIISQMGGESFQADSEQLPFSTGGLMGCHIDDKSSAFFSTSNRMFVQFEGDGSFSLERFEQTEPDPET